MIKETYQSKRDFRIWHYIVSHSLLNKDVEYSETYNPNCTIDIEFSDVSFISLPDILKGINFRKENGVYRF